MKPVLEVEQLGHTYTHSGRSLEVFCNVNFCVARSELVAVQGESGSGKTTLLLACGAMQRPTHGTVYIGQENVFALPAAHRAKFRGGQIGYLFQTLQLIPYLSLLDNIRVVKGVSTATARHWLAKVGLDDRLDHKPDALSHGQRQRAALARAMAHRPALVIADEPTGNLDSNNSRLVFETLREFANEGAAVLIATHDSLIEKLADRTLNLHSGILEQAQVKT